MPQLQTKVPTLTRWGCKMAVVIDAAFWESLRISEDVEAISNCDIVWFIVDYKRQENGFRLVRGKVAMTTLAKAVEGLTGGVPVTKESFEESLLSKLSRLG